MSFFNCSGVGGMGELPMTVYRIMPHNNNNNKYNNNKKNSLK